MKKSTIKIVMFGIIFTILTAITTIVLAETEYKSIILKTEDNEYIVYYEDAYESEFQFAISDSKDDSNLTYRSSVKDTLGDNGLNVAYIDSTTNPTNATILYLWAIDNDDNEIVSAYKIDLSDALVKETTDLINTTTIANGNTDRIKIDTTQKRTTNSDVDGVDTTITTGKIVIDEKENAKYSYNLIPATEGSEAEEVYKLVDRINNFSGNTYERLKLYKKFYGYYMKLMPQYTEWNDVKDSTILQPDNSNNGDKYIVYIKEELEDESEIIDLKLLICTRIEEQGVKEIPGQIPVNNPVTYDSITLFVVLAIIIIAIIITLILKAKYNKKSEK